ncbi:DEAD/DEAH box helicase family protein [Bacteroides sp. AN502]|nr:DEAD/DEAH box helicase family protein [Caecibacteroides pullorum]
MATYSTLEEIKVDTQANPSSNNLIVLRSEQRDAIDQAKERFCKKTGRKGDYQYTVLPESRQFLWNAKMRFGKTICAMQLMREMDVKRTLIITHRPVVGDSWLNAFRQVVGSKKSVPKVDGNSDIHHTYGFGTRSDNESEGNFYDLEKFVQAKGNHFAFFVSMQYMRLSELVNLKTQAKYKNQFGDNSGGATKIENEKLKADILNADWDLVIIDEAHEGTRTSLGKSVIDDFLKKDKTKMLYLSGTPFNLYEDFKEDEIYTWDYIAEQQAKKKWYEEHPSEKNPYEELPKMNIFTYDITKNINNVLDQTGIFTFPEFFRTWTGNPKADNPKSDKKAIPMPVGAKGRFVHETDVLKFLNLLCTKDAENNFPFSTTEYRKMFRHTLWVVSHVNEAAALEQLLNEHPTFRHFKVVNVAGKNDADEQSENALDKVLNAIGELPEKTSTITISCGRLTTGVTVAPWTAVFYLKGGDRAATYMQTIFRVQSPYKTPDGKMKTECYVFDFAPDRTLKIVAETSKFSSMAKTKDKQKEEGEEEKTQEMRDKETVRDFIELCPVISMDGGKMSPMDVNTIYKKLESVYIDRLVRKGFDDNCLYVQEELNKIDPKLLNQIGENGGQAPDEKRKDAKETIDLSHMTEEQRAAWEEKIRQKKAEAAEKAKKKAQKDEEFQKQWDSWTEEQRQEWLDKEAERIARREQAKKEREEFRKRITNIRGIALRIPLLMYGGADAGDTKEDITVDNFTRKIKDESWAEFMPKGISKADFNKIKKCFNATRFEEAGKKYRALTREADFMHVDERIRQITEIFSYFRNPDKETVLTPWRVVNMHMSDTIGGWCFYDETFDEKTGQLETPRYVDQGDVTRQLFDNVDLAGEVQTKILEINSKTGLYPLYVTYSLYRRRLDEYIKAECIERESVSVQEEQVVWDDIVKDNIYVICNTPMAVGITRRTLFGFRDVERKANIKNEELIKRASNDQEGLVKELRTVGFWKGNSGKQEMKFNAVVGNPPYQMMDGGAQASATPVYNLFVNIAKKLQANYVSMIMPARWYSGGKGLDEFRNSMLEDKHISRLDDFLNPETIFPNTNIRGGLCYFLWDINYNSKESLTRVVTHGISGIVADKMRQLKTNNFDMFIRNYEAISIIEKVKAKDFNSIAHHISARKPFGFATDFIKDASFKTSPETLNSPVLCYGKGMCVGYVERNQIKTHQDWIDKWKVLIPRANNIGTELNDDNLNSFICAPGEVTTESYLVVGADLNLDEKKCLNIKCYLSTKFARFMHSMAKSSQDATSKTFIFVPIQDFSKPWTDEELYNKYELDIFEREYIESMIKPME